MSQTGFKDGLGYEGKVTLTLKSNDRMLMTKTYKNNGTVQLFKFLGYCLTDSYEEAKDFLPTKIMLLHNKSNSPVGANAADVEMRTEFKEWAQTPTRIDRDGSVSVIYSFEVAKNDITGTFNQVALYGSGRTLADIANFSAYYYLTDGFGAFDNQDIEGWSATTVLLIEWELSISNKNVDTNNSLGE